MKPKQHLEAEEDRLIVAYLDEYDPERLEALHEALAFVQVCLMHIQGD
jgi:hypothetical protein